MLFRINKTGTAVKFSDNNSKMNLFRLLKPLIFNRKQFQKQFLLGVEIGVINLLKAKGYQVQAIKL